MQASAIQASIRDDWVVALAAHRDAVASARRGSPRWCGGRLMEIGAIVCAAGVPVSLALMNIGFVAMLAGALLARAPLWRMPGFIAGCALSAWMLLSVIATMALGRDDDPAKGFALGYVWLAPSLVAFAVQRPRIRPWIVQVLAFGMLCAAVLAATQFCLGWDHRQKPWRIDAGDGLRWERGSGFFASGLTLGGVAAIVGLTLRGERGHRRWRHAGIAGAALALVVSRSRMAWLSVFAGWCVATAIARRWRRLALAVLVLPGIAVAALFAFKPDALKATARGEDGRWVIWSTSATLIADHPLIGCGGRAAFNRKYRERWRDRYGDGAGLFVVEPSVEHAHNSLLAVAAEHGVPATALHVAWWCSMILAAWRRRRAASDAWETFAAIAIAVLVAGLFNNIAGQGEYGHALGLGLGLAWASLGGTAIAATVLAAQQDQ
ncbi:MAG TPA: O-antigen ligase family protein [Planctomycetota bacterium]|nr:O-antigen ligase family protein [Planctomycetota bacterium]